MPDDGSKFIEEEKRLEEDAKQLVKMIVAGGKQDLIKSLAACSLFSAMSSLSSSVPGMRYTLGPANRRSYVCGELRVTAPKSDIEQVDKVVYDAYKKLYKELGFEGNPP